MSRRKYLDEDQLGLDGIVAPTAAELAATPRSRRKVPLAVEEPVDVPAEKKLTKREIRILERDKNYFGVPFTHEDGYDDIRTASRTYVVTAAQMEVAPCKPVLDTLEHYAKSRNAQLIVIPVPKTWKLDGDNTGYVHRDLDQPEIRIMSGRSLRMNSNVQVTNDLVPAQNVNPLTGLGRFTQAEMTSIIGSPKQFFEVIANSNQKLPHVNMSTGVITLADQYVASRQGHIARRDHTYGAIIVEVVDDNHYHTRPVRLFADGSMVDLGMRWQGDRDPTPATLEALVLGDIHVGDTDPVVWKATMEMIDEFKPKRIFLHDLFNGHSVNYHIADHLVTKARYFEQGRHSLEEELVNAREFLKELSRNSYGAELYVVASNHHDFLAKYLEGGLFTQDPGNVRLAAQILPKLLDERDPVEAGLLIVGGKLPKRVTVLPRESDYKVFDFQLAAHGDKGGNGMRAPIGQRERLYGKSITGHSHTPAILRNTYVVGTSTYLKLDYNRSEPTSWLNTHGLLWNHAADANDVQHGKVQLVNIIDGDWRGE